MRVMGHTLHANLSVVMAVFAIGLILLCKCKLKLDKKGR